MVDSPLNPRGVAVFTGLRTGSGPLNIHSPLAAAALAGKGLSASHHLLASYIRLGERAQGARDAVALAHAGSSILELPLRQELSYVGEYYLALALNRQGPAAYPDANKILLEVADRAGGIFRAKAMVAYGTNCNNLDDCANGFEALSHA
ncbi:MAG TPA: hypothetical protein VI756_00600, partial [Blastocatellia bacterium]